MQFWFWFQVIEKNKRKFDEEKTATSELKRENQCLVDSCDSLAKAKEKLEHDLHTRQQRLNCLDGELQAAKKVNDKKLSRRVEVQKILIYDRFSSCQV